MREKHLLIFLLLRSEGNNFLFFQGYKKKFFQILAHFKFLQLFVSEHRVFGFEQIFSTTNNNNFSNYWNIIF